MNVDNVSSKVEFIAVNDIAKAAHMHMRMHAMGTRRLTLALLPSHVLKENL